MGMQFSPSDHRRLVEYFLELVRYACAAFPVLPGELMMKNNHRGPVQARYFIMDMLRATVGASRVARRKDLWSIDIDKHGNPNGQPLSYPVIGRMFGVGHSALVHATQNRGPTDRHRPLEVRDAAKWLATLSDDQHVVLVRAARLEGEQAVDAVSLHRFAMAHHLLQATTGVRT